MTTQIIDLSQVYENLEKSQAFGPIKRAIAKVKVLQSCVVDLHDAEQCLISLRSLLAISANGGLDQPTEAALLATAIQLYIRATVTSLKKDGDRGSSQICAELKSQPAQLADHEALKALRNHAIAHVYEDEILDGQAWNRAAVFLYQHNNMWWPSSATNRIKFDGASYMVIERQLPVAFQILSERLNAALDKLRRCIEDSKEDPDLMKILGAAMADPTEFFGSEDAAEAVIAASATRPGGLTSLKL
jgi:hypothetical protein